MRERFDTVTVISKWLNEEDLAPFFMGYYAWADEIIILLDDRTDDRSKDIALRCRHARIVPISYPDGFDCTRAIDKINFIASGLKTDWAICVDADEFLFPHGGGGIRKTLSKVEGEVVYVDFWQVYRNKTELDLNPAIPVLNLRRYGDPNRETGYNALFRKPCILRTGMRIEWEVGHHNFHCADEVAVSRTRFDGAHWSMADANIAVKRRMKWRRECLSKEDVKQGFSLNNYKITEKEIRQICKDHENDPQVF